MSGVMGTETSCRGKRERETGRFAPKTGKVVWRPGWECYNRRSPSPCFPLPASRSRGEEEPRERVREAEDQIEQAEFWKADNGGVLPTRRYEGGGHASISANRR